ncbi:cobalt-precorrin-4 C(11)-methyltransferase [Desulfocarbo indianensis]|nr:cobalt-precorrin-4 C(11)-methyltransferase [Desulfocarbo indianensis]
MSERHDNPVLFVGAGPGDPELITVAGQKAVAGADLVVYAGSLVNPAILDWARPDCRLVDSAGLALDEIVAEMTAGHGRGLRVARLHTGDPSLYGAMREQLDALDEKGVPWLIIPGVSAAFAAAACLGVEYTLPETCQSFIITRAAGRTPVPASEDLASLAAHGSSLAIYLSAGQAPKVSAALSRAHGAEAPVCVAYRVSWPEQSFFWTTAEDLPQDLERSGVTRHALILAGPGVAARAPGAAGAAAKSRLYDPAFSHGFRPAREDEA